MEEDNGSDDVRESMEDIDDVISFEKVDNTHEETISHLEGRKLDTFESQADDEVQVIDVDAWTPSRINSIFNQIGEESKKTVGGSMGQDSPVILITSQYISMAAVNKMKKKYRLLFLDKDDSQEAILTKVYGVDAIFHVGYNLKLDRDMLDFIGKKLTVVGLMHAGYDKIDVRELTKRKIKIGNTKSVQTEAVAEVAIALALTVAHRFKEGYMCCTKGKWVTGEPDWLLGKQLTRSICGIVGFGDIGIAIAKRLVPFNVKQIVYSGHGQKRAAKESAADFVDFSVLLSECDFIFIACPLTYETQNMFNYEMFKLMKPTCVLVNVGTGGVIKTNDLVKALRERLIWGAGLDVTDPEPLPLDHPLLHLPNCFVSPCVGSATVATRDAMAIMTAQNIMSALEGKPMPSEVCFKPDPIGVSFLSYGTREPTRTPANHFINISNSSVFNNP